MASPSVDAVLSKLVESPNANIPKVNFEPETELSPYKCELFNLIEEKDEKM